MQAGLSLILDTCSSHGLLVRHSSNAGTSVVYCSERDRREDFSISPGSRKRFIFTVLLMLFNGKNVNTTWFTFVWIVKMV